MTNYLPTIALASCTTSAIGIATQILSRAPAYRDADIVMNLPLFPNPAGYNGIEKLIENTLDTMQALLSVEKSLDVAIGVFQEKVTWRSSRRRCTFSVGLVVSCYRHGPLFLSRGGYWVPEEELPTFDKHAQEIIDRLQENVPEPPAEDVVNVAKLITKSLTLIPMKTERVEVSLH